jgi:hypothetical protein
LAEKIVYERYKFDASTSRLMIYSEETIPIPSDTDVTQEK